MSNVQRICGACGQPGPLTARYCAHCGYDSQGELPVQNSNVTALVGRAALPVLVGAAGMAMRFGWRLLQSRAVRETAQDAARRVVDAAVNRIQSGTTDTVGGTADTVQKAKSASPQPPARQPVVKVEPPNQQPARRSSRRTVHIRSSWAVGNADGSWRRGTTEHTIEIDD